MCSKRRTPETSINPTIHQSTSPPCCIPKTLFLPRLMSKAAKTAETKFFQTGTAKDPFVFASGDQLPGITVAYETHGKLNADKSNAILLFHALSGSQHAAGAKSPAPTNAGRRTSTPAGGISSSDPTRRSTRSATSSSARTTSVDAMAPAAPPPSIPPPGSPTAAASRLFAPVMW